MGISKMIKGLRKFTFGSTFIHQETSFMPIKIKMTLINADRLDVIIFERKTEASNMTDSVAEVLKSFGKSEDQLGKITNYVKAFFEYVFGMINLQF